MSKYFNNAIVGNSNILGCLTDKGELIRLYYPYIDYFQNIDNFKMGIIKNNSIVGLKMLFKKINIMIQILFILIYRLMK